MGADGRNVTDMAQIMQQHPTIYSIYREESPVIGHKSGDTPQIGGIEREPVRPKFEESMIERATWEVNFSRKASLLF